MNKTYIPALIVAILLASLHFIATAEQWYVRFTGFDIIMHLLGGMAIALAIYWTMSTFTPKWKPTFIRIVAFTFVAGVAWETFETIYNIAGAPLGTHAYYVDSIKDLVNDTLGAVVVSLFVKK